MIRRYLAKRIEPQPKLKVGDALPDNRGTITAIEFDDAPFCEYWTIRGNIKGAKRFGYWYRTDKDAGKYRVWCDYIDKTGSWSR